MKFNLMKMAAALIALTLSLALASDAAAGTEDAAQDAGVPVPETAASEAEAGSEAAAASEAEDFDIQSLLFGHIQDSYEWHITDIGDKSIRISLPVIVRSSTGWHCFMSSKLEDGAEYEGLFISSSDRNEGKIVELDASGQEVRPLDISITKNVLALMINSAILVILILACARWYRRHDALGEAPSGVAAVLEPVIEMINDDVIKDSVGPDYAKYSPYLLTVFFFILINNLMGIVPFFPGGANVTGNITITFVLALITFLLVNLTTSRHYWKDIFWPDVPLWLKPIIVLIEIFGVFTKPFALMIRLFANIMAGHSLILCVVAIIFITAKMGAAIAGSMTVVSVVFGVFMDCLELLVAFIQAYVFTMLSAVFIGLARERPEKS